MMLSLTAEAMGLIFHFSGDERSTVVNQSPVAFSENRRWPLQREVAPCRPKVFLRCRCAQHF